ncbi:MAG: glucose-1-phosphate cytidylyltransferase, partial [Lentisphaeria bacterium]|nr:glucose-1-phosphate cytidylyltransferase [Lentisphaeria bacterium]
VIKKDFVSKYLAGRPDDFFERAPMQNAVADGNVQVYRHDGFWQCMDNPREYTLLNSLWENGNAPWTKYWK